MKRNEQKTLTPGSMKGPRFIRRSGYTDSIFSNLTLFFAIVMVVILVALVIILNQRCHAGD